MKKAKKTPKAQNIYIRIRGGMVDEVRCEVPLNVYEISVDEEIVGKKGQVEENEEVWQTISRGFKKCHFPVKL